MDSMFSMYRPDDAVGVFRGNGLSSWDVSSVTDMSGMLSHTSISDLDLSNWNTSSVTTMSWMFSSSQFVGNGLSSWNVSSVTDMYVC